MRVSLDDFEAIALHASLGAPHQQASMSCLHVSQPHRAAALSSRQQRPTRREVEGTAVWLAFGDAPEHTHARSEFDQELATRRRISERWLSCFI
jgi:hypothetical protein